MDITDVIILMLLISIMFLCLIGFGVYFLNLQYQKNTIDRQLNVIQSKSEALQEEKNYEKALLSKSQDQLNQLQRMSIDSNPIPPGIPINIPTRGMEQYRQLGILTSLSDSKIVIPLYGRRTYVRSQNWNYYTLTNGYQSIQISVSNKNKDCSDEYGCDEIYSDDLVYIPAYNENFRALMYKNNAPRYIPFI